MKPAKTKMVKKPKKPPMEEIWRPQLGIGKTKAENPRATAAPVYWRP
jgi:hypothetical protein